MKVFYSPYTLTPLKQVNRLSNLESKAGIYLKGVLGNKVMFADYHPHPPMGDKSCDEFLSEFKFQKEDYEKKVFDLLLRDNKFQNLRPKKFYNHQLWIGTESIESPVVKYKLLSHEDRKFMVCLEKGLRLRLDSNALFNRPDFINFMKDIPEKYHALIDYVEDPLADKDWSALKVPSARDFVEGTPFDFYIYKPNCEFKPATEAKIIFSSYLGSDLGRWHAYCDLVENGDLKLVHGIITQGFFQEERYFMKGSFREGFMPENEIVRRVYQDVTANSWKLLCSI